MARLVRRRLASVASLRPAAALLCGAFLALLGVPPDASAEEAARVGPFQRADYPTALIDRPLTLPAGMVEGELGATFRSQTSENVVGHTRYRYALDDWDLDLALRVGVTDRLELEVGTGFSLDHVARGEPIQGYGAQDLRDHLSSWNRTAPLTLRWLAVDTDRLDSAVALTLPFTAYAERTIRFGRGGKIHSRNGDGRVLPSVELAVPTRWRLDDRFWLRAGESLFSVTTGSGIARFGFDIGVGAQLHRTLALTLDTTIASVAFDGSGDTASSTWADAFPLRVMATWSPLPFIDLIGGIELPDAGDLESDYRLRTGVRVRF